MCHVNDALAYPSEGSAMQKSSVLSHIPAGRTLAALFQTHQACNRPDASQRLVSFPYDAGIKPWVTRTDSDHGAQQ